MALVPLEGGETREPGVLRLTDRMIQQGGIRFSTVESRKLAVEIDTTGRIELDERRLSTLTAWTPGRIEKLHVNFTGMVVDEGDLLAELYSDDLVVALEEFILAFRSLLELEGEGPVEEARRLVQSARLRLLRKGLVEDQLQEVEETLRRGENPLDDKAIPRVPIHAPRGGTVLKLPIQEGEYVRTGTPLIEIADLSRLWVIADIFEGDLPTIREGQAVEIRPRGILGRKFEGRVSFVDPVVDPRTRTVRVRCDVDNPDGVLKPGMFARIRVRRVFKEVLSVPDSAVVFSGRRRIVFVEETPGRFTPRAVRLGRTFLYPAVRKGKEGALPYDLDEERRYHEVRSGLNEGDRVVAAGTFLVYAEAQFQNLLAKFQEAQDAKEAACAWDGRPASKAELPVEHKERQKVLRFHSEEELDRYREKPDQAWVSVRERFQAALDDALESYSLVRKRLAEDSLQGVPPAFREIRERLDAARPALEGAHLHGPVVKPRRRTLTAVTDAVPENVGGLLEARKAFARVSDALIAALRRYRPGRIAKGEVFFFT